MMNRHFLSAAVGLALSAGAGFAIAQGASAPRMEKAMQAAQSIRDAQPSATTTPPTTTPAARTAQVAETSVRPTQAAPSPQASIPVAAAPSPKTEAAQAGAEADELSILQRQAAVLKVKAEIAKYQADIKSSESRAMQAATSVTPGQAGEPGVVPSLVVPGMIGFMGTITAHELTHRTWDPVSMFFGRWLLAFSFDTIFAIEHVYGHHRYVSTIEDPATAPRGRSVEKSMPIPPPICCVKAASFRASMMPALPSPTPTSVLIES